MNWILDGIVGALTGVLSGFGVGGGTLLILYGTMVSGYSQLQAQGINLMYFIPTAAASLYGHIKNRLIEVCAFWWASAAGVASTALSALVVGSLPTDWLRRGFGGFLILVGLRELFSRKDG